MPMTVTDQQLLSVHLTKALPSSWTMAVYCGGLGAASVRHCQRTWVSTGALR